MYLPSQTNYFTSRAITLTVASLCLTEGLIRPVIAQFSNHSEQGAEPPPNQGPPGFSVNTLIGEVGSLMAVPGPGVHGFDTRLYVLLRDHHMIVQVDPFGTMTRFAALPKRVANGTTSLTFDVKGNYGGGLIFGGTGKRIGRVSASGSISFLRTPQAAGPRRKMPVARGLACDPYGAFDGRLFLAADAGSIFEVSESGRRLLLTSGRVVTGGGNGGHAMHFSPGGAFGAFLYIADKSGGRIQRIAPDHVPGEDAPVWRNMAELNIEPSGIAISPSGPFGTNVMYVLDERLNRIVTFAADGTLLGTFMDGLQDGSSIELPQTGMFRRKMVIVSPDAISIVRPDDAPGYEHDPGPFGDLDNDQDVDALDLWALMHDLACNGPWCVGDLNNDGRTDFDDIEAFILAIVAVQ